MLGRPATRSIVHPAELALGCVVLIATVFVLPAAAGERELDEAPPPSSATEIHTPIQRVFAETAKRPPLFPFIRKPLQKLPPFFADTQIEARFRTYYLRQNTVRSELQGAWAMGGSVAYRSGWLADTFRAELEGFTSQPIVAPDGRDGTFLLAPGQNGYTVLGIANAQLRYKGIGLTGYRQYLDLPYVNRNDNRMTPNTFEAITLAKPEGKFKFSAGYAWRIKGRNSDEFESFTEALGARKKRGFAHGGVIWDPHDDLHLGAIAGVVPDGQGGIYGELGIGHPFIGPFEGRLDGQFTGQWEVGDAVFSSLSGGTWNLGLRGSASWEGLVFRLGFTVTGSSSGIFAPFGTNPSYVDLMQQSFTRADEKALLVSLSYDFSHVGVDGLSVIMNFVAGFDGDLEGERRNAQEIDLTVDYRIGEGFLETLWLRVRGSWLHEEGRERDGSDVRVILRYDFPVI